MNRLIKQCPGCGHAGATTTLYHCSNIPVNSVILFRKRQEAVNCFKGNIHLSCCPSYGLIYNNAYDPLACKYNENYEESQSHSQVFNAFHHELADYLINKYDLREKNILEIGCGKGDFLNLICSIGDNSGTGYDPAYVAGRSIVERSEKVTIFNREFPSDAAKIPADFIICKMTLEHIPMTADFLNRIRKSIVPDRGTKVFFQVPDTKPILEQSQFWDIYYEHCSYFTNDSLSRIFRFCGFQVLHQATAYDGQYLLIEAAPDLSGLTTADKVSTVQEMKLTNTFGDSIQEHSAAWRNQLVNWRRQKKGVVLWGGGSKAVSFLTTLDIKDEVMAVVDINPHKEGTFLPGTGHEIVAPSELKQIQPDIIVIMNPVYQEEINGLIKELQIRALTIPVTQLAVQQNAKLM